MDIKDAIKCALNNDAILFVGSGFSVGATNIMGDCLKVGKELAHSMCRDLGIDESDDLTITSQRYIDDPRCNKTVQDLIRFLKCECTCTEVSESHRIIASLPWKRIYTTNYDNVLEVATLKSELKRSSITITNKKYSGAQRLDEAIIHINGFIKTLSEKTFFDEFKITDDNYVKDGFLERSWKTLFEHDLRNSSAIVFIGYSLNYDQDLVKLLANLGIKDKCIFIDINTLDGDSEFKLRKYGSLFLVGTDGFAEEAREVKQKYIPSIGERKAQGLKYVSFGDYIGDSAPLITDVIDLWVRGNIERKFMSYPNYYLAREERINDVISALQKNNIVLVTSTLGNGKTVFLESLAMALCKTNDVYFVNNDDYLDEDMNIVLTSRGDRPIILVVDDIWFYTRLLSEFGKEFPDGTKIVATCRSSIFPNLYYDMLHKYNYDMNSVGHIDITKLNNREIEKLSNLLSENRLWSSYDFEDDESKKNLLKKNYKRQLAQVFYLLLKSESIKNTIDALIKDVKSKLDLFDFVLMLTVNSICNLKLSYYDILNYSGIDSLALQHYCIDNPFLNEILDCENNKYRLHSAIYSKYIVKEGNMKNDIMDCLKRIYTQCSKGEDVRGRHYQQRRNLVSRSNIKLMLGDGKLTKQDEEKILVYYSEIKNLPTAKKNPYFWLQYGITALNICDFALAKINFDTAYTYAKKMSGFDTFQIDTHKARLILCSEMHRNRNNPASALESFLEAHKVLNELRCDDKDIIFVLRQIDNYHTYYYQYRSIWSNDEKNEFLSNAIKMVPKFEQYFGSEDMENLGEVKRLFVEYRKIFDGTNYAAEFINVNSLYRNKVQR